MILLAAGLAAALAALLFAMAVTAWREFRLTDAGLDLAWFNQGLYAGLHGSRLFDSTVISLVHSIYNHSLLEGHFSPIYYGLLPLYALWPSPLLLLLIASCGVAVAGMTGMLAARRILGSTAVAVAWFVLYALHPSVGWSVVADGFHEPLVTMGLLGAALWCYIESRYGVFFLMVVLAILTKEDVALLLPVWGIVAGLQRRGWGVAGTLIVLGVAYAVAANAVVLPLIRGEPVGHFNFNALPTTLGHTPGDIVHSIWSAPAAFIGLVSSRQHLLFWAAILSPLLFLPLLGWEYLVIPAYVYGEYALAPGYQHIPSRYVFPALPFIFVAGMIGTARFVRFLEHLNERAAGRHRAILAAVTCALLAVTVAGTPLPMLVRANWPAAVSRRDASLLNALARIPPQASVAATASLVAESGTRPRLYFVGHPELSDAYVARLRTAGPDYLAIALSDLADPQLYPRVSLLLCQGGYGVTYVDRGGSGRFLLGRSADESMNLAVDEEFLPPVDRECPAFVQPAGPEEFRRAAGAHVHVIPSDVRPEEMLPEPAVAAADGGLRQVIHLPDHAFEAGWYRLDLMGVWPWPGSPPSSQLAARVRVGGHDVGQAAAAGGEPLEYATAPFHIDRHATLPIEVTTDLVGPASAKGGLWALRPTRGGCAVVRDAPNLNPRSVTVEALVYADGIPPHSGAEAELPIVSKNNAPGYYLRLVADPQGKVWADFSVAWKWSLARAGAVPLRRWTVVTATYNGHEAGIYLDGRRAPQAPGFDPRFAGPVRSQDAPLAIGCRDPGQSYEVLFPGLVGSVRVWNRVISDREILDEAGRWARPAARLSGLVGSWGFQAIDGGVVPDLSAAGNPIQNGAQLSRVLVSISPSAAPDRARELNILRRVTVRAVRP